MVAIAMIGGAAIAFAFAVTSTKQYTAESNLLIRQSNLQTLIDPSAAQNSEDPARLAATNLLLVTSTAVAKNVQSALRTNESISDLDKPGLGIRQPRRGHHHDPGHRPESRTGGADRERLCRPVRGLRAGAVTVAGRSRRRPPAQRDRRSAGRRDRGACPACPGAAQRARAPGRDHRRRDRDRYGHAPVEPFLPEPQASPVLGLLAGLAIGLAAVFLTDLFDRRIKSIEDFESAYDRRAIGSLPRLARPHLADEPRVARILPDPAQRLELPGR